MRQRPFLAGLFVGGVLLAGIWMAARWNAPPPAPVAPGRPRPPRPEAPDQPETLPVPRIQRANVTSVPLNQEFDLLRLLDPAVDAVKGTWTIQNGALQSSEVPFCRTYLPCLAPEEYDLKIVAERVSGENSFNIGLAVGGTQFLIAIDGWQGGGFLGLDMLDGKPFYDNATTIRRRVFLKEKKRTIRCVVRKNRLAMILDNEPPIEWKPEYVRLSVWRDWAVPEKNALFLGTYESSFRIHEILLTPITGSATLFR